MSTDNDPWDDPAPAPLPTILKPSASLKPSPSPVETFDAEDEDDGGGLWVDDDDDGGWAQTETTVSEHDLVYGDVTAEDGFSDPTSEAELPDADVLFQEMMGGGADDLPDPDALFQQMQGGVSEEDLPDAEALFRQMQAGAIEEELPDAEALFRQMQAGAVEEELPDAEALFRQMQGGAVEEELPDAEALFRQMQGGAGQEELPDAEALFRQMQAAAPQELPDPDALFLQMQAQSSPPTEPKEPGEPVEEDLPDPGALFLAMQSERTVEEDDLPDPNALFLEMKAREPEALASPAAGSDDLPDPDSLFQQMQSRLQASAAPPLGVGADALFLQAREGGRQVGDELPDPDALFQQMQAREASLPLVPDPLVDDLPDPNALFLQMQAREAIAAPPAAQVDDLPDPNALFLQMQAQLPAEGAYVETGNEWLPPLPQPSTASPRAPVETKADEKGGLFSRLKAKFRGEKKGESDSPKGEPPRAPDPLPATGVGAALPDPAELFRRMQAEPDEVGSELPTPSELFRRLKSGEQAHPLVDTPSGLPALPDLDALRAEMEAEEKARLDADLLDDLSGPERFADTVSDLAFNAGSFFQAPPQPGSLHKPPERRQDKLSPAPRPFPSDEPLPAMLSKPDAKPAPPVGGGYQPPATSYQPTPVAYQPSPAPVKRKSSSTSLASKDVPARSAVEKAELSTRLAKFKSRRKSLSRYTLSVITRQMAAMLKAGIGLHQAVTFCAESDPEAAPVLNDVCDKIGAGFSLSGALREYPGSFDPVFVGLVHAGELSGRLTEMLGKLADMLERELELRKRVISVITYPAMLMAVSILGTLGFIFFVLPQLTPMFLDLKVDLPLPTKILLSLRTVLLPLTLTFVALCLAALAMRSRIEAYVAARPFVARRLAYFPLSLPVLGPVYDKMVTARVLYSLATMLEVGVTMNQALARAEGTSGNAYVGYRLMKARMDLAEGASVTECFENHQVFPKTALQLISAGEESARLVDMFSYIARHFDDEVEQAMTTAAGLLEPMIMVVMGLIVGFITIAAAMPTIKLLQGF